ncbi:MAG: ABC transporter substrate-binding protein [Veillonellaceae bacterium]|nr:ABC transporter substrate-binding protein [Veillonellaceae bacterium]
MLKQKTKSLCALALAGVMLASLVAGCGGSGAKEPTKTASKEPIKFGIIGPYTGPNAKPGQSMKQGVNLAVEEINKAGGVKGRQLVAMFEDDASVPAQSVSATEKLINKDEVAFLIGTFNSATTLADMKIIERDKTPMLVPIAVAIEITESGNKWVFRNSATNPMQAEQLMNYIYKQTKQRKFAVIHENTDYGKGLMLAVESFIKKNGGSMIAESYSIGDTDFYAQLTKIKNNAPEALIICGNLSEGSQITRQFKELGIKAQLYGFGGLSSYDFNNVAAGSNEGLIATSYFENASPNPLAQNFIKAYKAKYNVDPDMFAAAIYESVYLAKDAIEKMGDTKDIAGFRVALRDQLAKVKDLPGVQGPTTFDAKGQADKQVMIIQWNKGQKTILFPKAK